MFNTISRNLVMWLDVLFLLWNDSNLRNLIPNWGKRAERIWNYRQFSSPPPSEEWRGLTMYFVLVTSDQRRDQGTMVDLAWLNITLATSWSQSPLIMSWLRSEPCLMTSLIIVSIIQQYTSHHPPSSSRSPRYPVAWILPGSWHEASLLRQEGYKSCFLDLKFI